MCLDVENEATPLGPPEWRTARKEHRCDECRRTIDPGERYWTYAEIPWDDDGPSRWKMCVHCRGTITLGAALTGCPEMWWWDRVHELDPDEGGFVGDIIEHHDLDPADRARMLRTVAGRRKEWRRRDGSLMPVPVVPEREAVSA